MRTRAARRGAGGGVGGDEQSALRSAHGERIINDVLEKLRGKVLLSRAMADLLSNRADAYARFYFRVRALQGVVQRPVSVHLFFLHGIDAQRGRSFSSSAIKNSSGASRLFEIAGGTRQVHIFLCRHRNRRSRRARALVSPCRKIKRKKKPATTLSLHRWRTKPDTKIAILVAFSVARLFGI